MRLVSLGAIAAQRAKRAQLAVGESAVTYKEADKKDGDWEAGRGVVHPKLG